MSELPEGIARAEPAEPKNSALGILARRGGDGGWEFLLGKRSRSSRFMPGHLAFPGGRLEVGDGPEGPEALRRCASRELIEETGLAVDPDSWTDAGERITPPMFPIRFRARFFFVEIGSDHPLPDEPPAPDEIESLGFWRAAEVVSAWEKGRALVPPPVLPLLRAMVGADLRDAEQFGARLREVNLLEERSPRIEFTRDIWMLPVATATLPPATHTNVWMPGRRSFVIIDPGTEERGEIDRLHEVIRRRTRETGAKPEAVVLTHHHSDHVAGAWRLAAELGLPVRAHPEVLQRFEAQASGLEIAQLRDGEILDVGGMELRALHTPGHAAGHLAFHDPDSATLLAGDLISGLSTILIDPSEGDMGLYLDSLRRVSELDCRTLLPSHGPPLPGSALPRLVGHREQREARIRQALSAGISGLSELAVEAYRDVPEMPPILTERQALSHLLHLEWAGEVRRLDAKGKRWGSIDNPSPRR